jgi:hypothetical protein
MLPIPEGKGLLRQRTGQPLTFAPEGPARPHAEGNSIAGRVLPQKQPSSSGAHHVQSPLMLLPAGTIYCGTPKHHLVGTVHCVLPPVLPDGWQSGNQPGHSSPAGDPLSSPCLKDRGLQPDVLLTPSPHVDASNVLPVSLDALSSLDALRCSGA